MCIENWRREETEGGKGVGAVGQGVVVKMQNTKHSFRRTYGN